MSGRPAAVAGVRATARLGWESAATPAGKAGGSGVGGLPGRSRGLRAEPGAASARPQPDGNRPGQEGRFQKRGGQWLGILSCSRKPLRKPGTRFRAGRRAVYGRPRSSEIRPARPGEPALQGRRGCQGGGDIPELVREVGRCSGAGGRFWGGAGPSTGLEAGWTGTDWEGQGCWGDRRLAKLGQL